VEEVAHPGLRRLLEGLYALEEAGLPPTLDGLREGLEDSPALLSKAFELQDRGLARPNLPGALEELLARLQQRRERMVKQQLTGRLHATNDHQTALELLRRLQDRSTELGPDTSSRGGPADRPPLAPSA
jgi:hypothetical protein